MEVHTLMVLSESKWLPASLAASDCTSLYTTGCCSKRYNVFMNCCWRWLAIWHNNNNDFLVRFANKYGKPCIFSLMLVLYWCRGVSFQELSTCKIPSCILLLASGFHGHTAPRVVCIHESGGCCVFSENNGASTCCLKTPLMSMRRNPGKVWPWLTESKFTAITSQTNDIYSKYLLFYL